MSPVCRDVINRPKWNCFVELSLVGHANTHSRITPPPPHPTHTYALKVLGRFHRWWKLSITFFFPLLHGASHNHLISHHLICQNISLTLAALKVFKYPLVKASFKRNDNMILNGVYRSIDLLCLRMLLSYLICSQNGNTALASSV